VNFQGKPLSVVEKMAYLENLNMFCVVTLTFFLTVYMFGSVNIYARDILLLAIRVPQSTAMLVCSFPRMCTKRLTPDAFNTSATSSSLIHDTDTDC